MPAGIRIHMAQLEARDDQLFQSCIHNLAPKNPVFFLERYSPHIVSVAALKHHPEPVNVNALADLSLHPELCEVMGRVSRRIVEKFSCEAFAENALRAARAACSGAL